MSIKERILILGSGQAGGNISQELELRDFTVGYINASNLDLSTLDGKIKVHIPGAEGCNKNRKKAIDYVLGYFDYIAAELAPLFIGKKYVFIAAAGGGGFGSGSTPILIDLFKERYPHIIFGSIFDYPSISESEQARKNAAAAYKEIMAIEHIGNVYILDNNNHRDKFKINEVFAERFDRLVSVINPDPRGIIDEAELDECLSMKGSVFLTEITSPDTNQGNEGVFFDLQKKIDSGLGFSVFTEYNKGCRAMIVSYKEEIDLQPVFDRVGRPPKIHPGYNDKGTFIASFGMPWPTKRMKDIIESIKENLQEQEPEEEILDIPDFDDEPRKTIAPKKSSFQSIADKYK